MTDAQTATILWVCVVQMIFVLHAAGFVAGVILYERAEPYDAKHRADRAGLSTWQSCGRVLAYNLVATDPDDLDERRAAVEATAAGIEERIEVWNRELLAGPLFDLPPVGPDVPERYEGSAGDLAYLALSDGALDRTAVQPLRPHPARVDTSELMIVDLDESDAYAGVP